MSKNKTRFLGFVVRCGQFVVYLAYRFVESLIFLTPLTVCWHVGSWLGWGASYVLTGYRRLATKNLTIAFGDEMDAREIRALMRRHFAALGRNFICSIKLTGMPLEEVAARVTYEGLEEVEAKYLEGKGVVAALLHMGTWELLSQVPVFMTTRRRSMLFQPLRNPFLNARIYRLRTRAGHEAFDRSAGFYKPMALLSNGGGLGILADQRAGERGVWCPLFGRLASTTNIAALFSVRTGCPIVPVGVFPIGVGRWKLVYEDPVGVHSGAAAQGKNAIGALTAEMNVVLEKMIRRAPEEWFWVHDRWKTPKPEFLLARSKRGVEFPAGFDPAKSLKSFNLLVRSPNWLGDACMAVPAIRAIKRGRPDLKLSVLAPENLAELWSRVEEVDVVLTKRDSDSPWKVGKGLRAKRFDAGLLLPNSLRSALEMKVARIPQIVGYRGHHRSMLLSQIVEGVATPGPTEHQMEGFLRLASAIGGGVAHIEEARAAARAPLARREADGAGKLRLGLCAGAQYGPAKQWPLERFAQAADKIRSHTDCQWVLFGSRGEVEESQQLARLMGGQCENLVGRTSMAELMTRLSECAVVLTNDTGTMHLADFLGVPTVAIFGSTDPASTGPMRYGHRIVRHHVICSPCFLRECPIDFRCMNEIDPAEVAKAVVEMVGARAVAGP